MEKLIGCYFFSLSSTRFEMIYILNALYENHGIINISEFDDLLVYTRPLLLFLTEIVLCFKIWKNLGLFSFV